MIERTKFSALSEARCPKCREGKIFKHSAFNYLKYSETHEFCPNCGYRFEREPSFFTGAMYLSYGMNVFLILLIGIPIFILGHNPDVWWYFLGIFPVLILSTPFNFQYSRVLMLYWFADY
ncbi:MAG: DUF983 domain-containing protein [Opitutaceae bacterium]|nr:DUF983 domain-containing protein [Cytophagales bacterium]